MKWLFLTVLVVVAGAIAAFGIYTWKWHDEESGLDNQQARAQIAAEQVARDCEAETEGNCSVRGVERVADGLWRATILVNKPEQHSACIAIDLRYFRVMSDRETIHGYSRAECPE